ncbi:hypothetical protein L9F63_000889, partial [Diploptera punctata]
REQLLLGRQDYLKDKFLKIEIDPLMAAMAILERYTLSKSKEFSDICESCYVFIHGEMLMTDSVIARTMNENFNQLIECTKDLYTLKNPVDIETTNLESSGEHDMHLLCLPCPPLILNMRKILSQLSFTLNRLFFPRRIQWHPKLHFDKKKRTCLPRILK